MLQQLLAAVELPRVALTADVQQDISLGLIP
jgi:hypothetical protein